MSVLGAGVSSAWAGQAAAAARLRLRDRPVWLNERGACAIPFETLDSERSAPTPLASRSSSTRASRCASSLRSSSSRRARSAARNFRASFSSFALSFFSRFSSSFSRRVREASGGSEGRAWRTQVCW